jgi:predicted secreted protein
MSVPTTAMSSTDRFAVQIIVTGLSGRTITLYTQGDNPAYAATTFAVGTPFGAATNCTFETTTEQVEVTSQTSAWFREYKNDVSTWSVTCDGLISMSGYSYLALMQKQLNKEPISIKFSINNDNADGSGTYGYSIFTGTANITSISLSGPLENVSTYSVSLQGTGAYSITGTTVIDGGTTISTTSVEMFTYTAAGGETTITWSGALGLSCISVTRGGVEVRTINTSGTPTGEDVTFNSSTGVLTFASSRALESDEFVRAIFK